MLTRSKLLEALRGSRKFKYSKTYLQALDSQPFVLVTDGHIGLDFLEQRLECPAQNTTLIHRYFIRKTERIPETTAAIDNSYYIVSNEPIAKPLQTLKLGDFIL